MARSVGSAFTGQEDNDPGSLRNIISDSGKAFLGTPEDRAALLQIGLGLMQPLAMGQTVGGHIAQGIGGGGEAVGRIEKENLENEKVAFKKRQEEDELDLKNRNQDRLNLDSQAYRKSLTDRTQTDRAQLKQMEIDARARLAAGKATDADVKMIHDYVNDIAADPKSEYVLKYKGKTPSEIRQMLNQSSAAPGTTPTTPPATDTAPDAPRDASARTPNTVYQTPKGRLKWTGTGWTNP